MRADSRAVWRRSGLPQPSDDDAKDGDHGQIDHAYPDELRHRHWSRVVPPPQHEHHGNHQEPAGPVTRVPRAASRGSPDVILAIGAPIPKSVTDKRPHSAEHRMFANSRVPTREA